MDLGRQQTGPCKNPTKEPQELPEENNIYFQKT